MNKFDHTMVLYPRPEAEKKFYSHNAKVLARLEGGEKFAIFFADEILGDGTVYLEKGGGSPSLYHALIVLGDGSVLPYPVFEMAYSNTGGSFKSTERAKYWNYVAGHEELLALNKHYLKNEREARIRTASIEMLLGVHAIIPLDLNATLSEFDEWMSGNFGDQYAGVFYLKPNGKSKREQIYALAELVREASRIFA